MSEKSCNGMCPIATLVWFISKKWTLFIIRTMSQGACCYSEIEKKLSDINPSILSSRLKELQDFGFVEKKIISDNPVKIQYILTEKWRSFSEEFESIISWSEKWIR